MGSETVCDQQGTAMAHMFCQAVAVCDCCIWDMHRCVEKVYVLGCSLGRHSPQIRHRPPKSSLLNHCVTGVTLKSWSEGFLE